MLGMLALQALDPPARMVPQRLGVAVGGSYQRHALAQETAQAGVDKIGVGRGRKIALEGFDRLVDQGESVIGRGLFIPGQGQGHAQERVGGGRGHAADQAAAQGLRAAQIAPDVKGQRLHARAQWRSHGFHRCGARAAVAHGSDHGSGGLQLAPQRNRFLGGIHCFHHSGATARNPMGPATQAAGAWVRAAW